MLDPARWAAQSSNSQTKRAETTTKKNEKMKFMEEAASSGVLDPARLAQEAPKHVRSASRAMEGLATEIQLEKKGAANPPQPPVPDSGVEVLETHMLSAISGISAGAEPQRAVDKESELLSSAFRALASKIQSCDESHPKWALRRRGGGLAAAKLESLKTSVLHVWSLSAAGADKALVQQARDVTYFIQDLQDRIEYRRLQSTKQLQALSCPWNRCSADKVMSDIKAVSEETRRLGYLLDKAQAKSPDLLPPHSVRTTHQTVVFGRDKERDDIVQLLIQPQGEAAAKPEVMVISLVGAGGIGKTTLAQMVFNDAVVGQHFDARFWVSASTSSNKMELAAEILRSAEPAWDESDDKKKMVDFQLLQSELRRFVASKRCLIVLDDVCDITDEVLLELLTPLQSADIRSRVLVTSRMPHMLGASEIYTVNPLGSGDSWSLLKEHALLSDAEDGHPNLPLIGRKIAEKLNGSPLPLKLVGGVLGATRSKTHWVNVLETGLHDDTALLLSYKHLPGHLKRCFAYCSLFPQDYKFDPEHLSRLWIAEGFVQPQGKPEKKMEDIAREYFDQLLSRSFFQEIKLGPKTYYLVHNLLHDLAKSVAAEDCFHMDDGMNFDIPSTVCHLSVTMNSLPGLTSFRGLENLRTLLTRPSLPSSNYFQEDFAGNLKCILEKSKHLRVLDLSGCILEELPQCIDGLLHLRYLSIHGSIQRLPESIGKLLHLQTLCFTGKCYLEKLPASITMLVNLRHLLVEAKYTAGLVGIGRLANIQGSLELHLEKREGRKLEEDCFHMYDDINCDIPSTSSSFIQLLQGMIEYGRLPAELLSDQSTTELLSDQSTAELLSNQSTAELLPALKCCLQLFASSEPLTPLAKLLNGVPDQIPAIPQDLDASTASSSITTPQAESQGSGSSRASDEEDVGVGDEASGAELAPTFINATVDRSPDVDGILNKILDAFRGIHLDIRSSDESTIHPANRDMVQSMEFFCGNTDRVQPIFDCWVSKLEEVAEWICQGDQGRRYIFLLNNIYDALQMCPGASFSNVEELTSRLISMIHRYKKSYFDECWVPLTNPCRLDKFTLAFNTICKRQMTWKVTAELRYTLRQEIADLILPPYILALEANQSALSEIFYSLKRVMAGKKKQERLTVEALEKVIKELFEGWTPR